MNALIDSPRGYENTKTVSTGDKATKLVATKYQSPVGGTPVFVMRTPTGQRTNTEHCPPPPRRQGRGKARRRVVFDEWDANVLESAAV